jgi:hypothetical protein
VQTEPGEIKQDQGKQLVEHHGCIACHEIEGLEPSDAATVDLGGEQSLPTHRSCLSGSNAAHPLVMNVSALSPCPWLSMRMIWRCTMARLSSTSKWYSDVI